MAGLFKKGKGFRDFFGGNSIGDFLTGRNFSKNLNRNNMMNIFARSPFDQRGSGGGGGRSGGGGGRTRPDKPTPDRTASRSDAVKHRSPYFYGGGTKDSVARRAKEWDQRISGHGGKGGGGGISEYRGPGQMAIPGTPGNAYAGVDRAAGFARREGARIQGEYDKKAQDLKRLYQLAETPEEKAQLQFMLDDIEAQRFAGNKIIKGVYNDAIGSTMRQSGRMEKRAGKAGKAQTKSYNDQSAALGEDIGDIASRWADAGPGLGVGTTAVSGDATDWMGVMQTLGQSEGAFEKRMGNIAAQDVRQMGNSMKKEKGAQTGDLEREAMRMAAGATFSHQQAVQQRIHQERMALAGQTADMWGRGVGANADFAKMGVDLKGQGALRSGDQVWESAMQDRGNAYQRNAAREDFGMGRGAAREDFARQRGADLQDFELQRKAARDQARMQFRMENGQEGGASAGKQFDSAPGFQQSSKIGEYVDAGDLITARDLAQRAKPHVRQAWMAEIRRRSAE